MRGVKTLTLAGQGNAVMSVAIASSVPSLYQQHTIRQTQAPASVIRFVGGSKPYVVVTLDQGSRRLFFGSQLAKTGNENKKTPSGTVSISRQVAPGLEDGRPLPTGQNMESAYYEDISTITLRSPKGLPLIIKLILPDSTWLHLNGVSLSAASRLMGYRYAELHLSGGVNTVMLGTADHE